MQYLISPDKKQYKANLHCHSVLSDGNLTPEALKELYKSHGYDILAITDHERPRSYQQLADPDFMMITGYECYIRPDKQGRYNPYNKEVHLNLFARDPGNTTMICYNEVFCKYLIRDNALSEITSKAGSGNTLTSTSAPRRRTATSSPTTTRTGPWKTRRMRWRTRAASAWRSATTVLM